MVGAIGALVADVQPVLAIAKMTTPSPPAKGAFSPDPNSSVGGARQRKGPFWMEEPHWFWALAAITFLLGLALFLLAVGFDRP